MRCLAFSALVLLALLAACSEDDERPPVQPCAGCRLPVAVPTATPSGGSSNGGGEAGAAQGGESAVPGIFTVTRFEDDTFRSTAPYTAAAQVAGEREGGGTLVADWSGNGELELGPLLPGGFVLVVPEATADALATLLPVPEQASDGSAELPLVRASVLENIFLLPTLPREWAAGRAHVVLELLGSNGLPLAGAEVDEVTAEVALYADGGTWSDDALFTDPTGLVVLVNVAAAEWPGRLSSVTVESQNATTSLPLRAVENAVTVLRAQVE